MPSPSVARCDLLRCAIFVPLVVRLKPQQSGPSLPGAQLLKYLRSVGRFALLLVLLTPSLARAQSVASTASAGLDVLVQSASTIVRGRIVSAKIEPHPQFANLQTVVITMDVSKVLKGEASSTLTFRQFVWNARDVPVFAGYKGAGEVLLFLNPVSPYGLTSPVGLEQGLFRILQDAKGNRYALNGRGNLGLFSQVANKATSRGLTFSKPMREMLAKPAGQAPLELFEEAIKALLGAHK